MADETTNAREDASKNSAPQPAPSTLPAPLPPATPSLPVVAPTATPVAPAAPIPVPPAAPAPVQGDLSADIAKILESTKLPDRREVASAAKPEEKPAQFDTALGAPSPEAARAAAAAPAATAATPAANSSPETVTTVHTLKDDLQHVVHDQKISLVRAVSLEEERKHRQTVAEAPGQAANKKRVGGIIFSAVLLLLLGGGAMFGVYVVMQRQGAAPPAIVQSSILFAESSVPFSLDTLAPGDVKQTLSQARTSSQGTLGAITRIVPTITVVAEDGTPAVRPATFGEFMEGIGSHIPDDLVRALADEFFFGIHTVDENAPIFVIPVTSYDHAFAGMLKWETNMNADLSPIFTPMPSFSAAGLPQGRVFEDMVKNNYDMRALADDSGTVQLYYSFPTQHVLIIAESLYSFTEIIARLQASRQL